MTITLDYDEFWDNLDAIDDVNIDSNATFLKDENRSSTIFPIFKNSAISTSIQFLSYWLKKHGNHVVLCLTLRDVHGSQLKRLYQSITEYKSYNMPISDFFPAIGNGFCGSVEVEVFSKNRPRYTFPAITVCYEGNGSSSLVHSCIRTYNKDETVGDYAIMYPQTGFDTHFTNHTKNFICFMSGGSAVYNLCIELVEGDVSRKYSLELRNDSYGHMHTIWLEDLIDGADSGVFNNPKCLIHHDLEDVFPRFYVGILNEGFPPTLTHTFFDTSEAEDAPDTNALSLRATNQDHLTHFDCAFSVPIFPSESFDTALRSYGQNLAFSGDALFIVYTLQGGEIYSRHLSQKEVAGLCGFGELDLSQLLQSAGVEPDQYYCVKLAFVDKNFPFPKRFKLALNVKRKRYDFGTNICFGPHVISDNSLKKPVNRRWFPVGGAENYLATIHNTSLARHDNPTHTECNIEFINSVGETLSRAMDVKVNGSVIIDVKQDKELSGFFGKEGGWCMVTSQSYLTDAYYFSLTDKQIGGDHAY